MNTHHGCAWIPAYGGGALAERECGAHGRSNSAKRICRPEARRFIYARVARARVSERAAFQSQVGLTRHVCPSVWLRLHPRGGPRVHCIQHTNWARGLTGEFDWPIDDQSNAQLDGHANLNQFGASIFSP